MEKSKSERINYIRALKIASDYLELSGKITNFKFLLANSKQIRLREFKQALANGTILSTPVEQSFKHDVYPILVYVPVDENDTKAFQSLISYVYDKDCTNINMITHQWFEVNYDNLITRLKAIEPEYKEVAKMFGTAK